MAFTAWLSLVVCSAAVRVFDETEPVDLLQRTLQLDGGSEGAAAQAERLRKVLPMAWIHVPKCGTSFANTLVGMPHFCPDAPENYDVESSAPDGCLFRVFAPNVCKSFCDQNYLHCWNGKDGNNYHAFVGNESQYLKVKGHMVGLFRQPEQRLLSAYYDGHDWINGGNGTRCDTSHTGELSVPDFAPLFAGSMTYQLTYPQPVHWGAKYGPTITRSLALEAAKRVKEGFAYVGLTEEWDLSICLFHAMFGGACHSSEFRNVRPGEHDKENDGEYDTSVLEGFQDELDGLVYAEAARIFHQNLALYNVSTQSCRAGCFQEAIKGLHDE